MSQHEVSLTALHQMVCLAKVAAGVAWNDLRRAHDHDHAHLETDQAVWCERPLALKLVGLQLAEIITGAPGAPRKSAVRMKLTNLGRIVANVENNTLIALETI